MMSDCGPNIEGGLIQDGDGRITALEEKVKTLMQNVIDIQSQLYYVEVGTIWVMPSYKLPNTKWRWCDGARLLIADYPDLASYLVGQYYNDGTEFDLPDLRDSFLLGSYDFFSVFSYGEGGGAGEVTLSVSNLPSHNHRFYARNGVYTDVITQTSGPLGATNRLANGGSGGSESTSTKLIQETGGGQAFSIIPPFKRMGFCIKALTG